jgi:demethylmenaquinone methyltransferase / 2-methoxy-6-polyprenyl-1,4-benzoquinol methylase
VPATAGSPVAPIVVDGSPYPIRGSPTFERDVRTMFTHIAGRYELFNHIATLGQDFLWRPRALWDLDRFRTPGPVRRVLDIGCGTGELAHLAARHYPGAQVVGADFTRAMVAQARATRRPPALAPRLEYGRATVLALPFPSGTFDLGLSAFVVRNLPRLPDAFRELRRVIAPGGTLLTLEVAEPDSPRVRRAFHAYFDSVVPFLGTLAHSAGPYKYLPDSLRSLPSRPAMVELLTSAGFDPVRTATQSSGIVTTYLARVPGAARTS